MKKLFKPFSVLFAAAALMTACSNDEPVPGGENNVIGDGMTAYLTVNIQAADDVMSRADYDNDQIGNAGNGDYIHGDADEHTVTSARFFFFDENKTFVSEASIWKDGANGTTENIEYFGKNLLVLKDLTTNTYPKYMLTVLNLPDDFKAASTLDGTRKAIVDIVNGKTFIMSTTSFLGSNACDEYGVNELVSDNFKTVPVGQQPVVSDGEGVVVYVERLAAKVQVVNGISTNVENGVGETEIINEDGTIKKETVSGNFYKVNATVAGEDNNEGSTEDQPAGLTEVYVYISNWAINGTAKNSYLTKDISGFTESGDNAPWTSTNKKLNWNDNDYYRSFWGKSVVYGQEIVTKGENKTLNYTNWAAANVALGSSDYCPENTNTVENIRLGAEAPKNANVKDGAVTSVIFAAQVFEKVAEGKFKALDMVRFNGVLYRKGAFLAYVLNSLNAQQNGALLNYWHLVDVTTTSVDGEGETIITTTKKWQQLDAEDLKLVLDQETGAGTGITYVKSELKADDNVEYYTLNADGSYSEAKTFDATEIANLNANLRKFYNANAELSIANAYTSGKMFYSIPIEHLVKRENTSAAITTGNYGVVRNHWYRLTLNSIINIGTGVFKPGDNTTTGEELIPDDNDDFRYYVGADINILSWKIVTQSVDL